MYPHTVPESAEYLRLALPRMSAQAAGFHPFSYAIWYEYVSGINRPLQAAIDAHTADGGKLDDAATFALFQQHVAGIDAGKARAVTEGFRRVLTDINRSAADAGQEASRFGDSLAQWSGEMGRGLAGEPRPAGLDRLLDDTRDMQQAIGVLQGRLESSQREIEALRVQVERAREDALADSLTGLANRRGFDQALAGCLAAPAADGASGSASPSLLLADIDHFKQVNDRYGHLFGDKVLRAVAQILRDNVKGRDTAARFGGEEFVVLLPETPLAGARALAERIRATIEQSCIRRGDTREAIERVTVSIGVARHAPGEALERFVERVDRALYRAKEAGRNRVMLAEPA